MLILPALPLTISDQVFSGIVRSSNRNTVSPRPKEVLHLSSAIQVLSLTQEFWVSNTGQGQTSNGCASVAQWQTTTEVVGSNKILCGTSAFVERLYQHYLLVFGEGKLCGEGEICHCMYSFELGQLLSAGSAGPEE